MAGPPLAGLEQIQAWAARLGIDITDTIQKANMLMATDPASVRAGSGQLNTMAGGIGSGAQDIARTGQDVLSQWTGSAADAFGPKHTDLVNHVGETANSATDLGNHLTNVAAVFEQSQNTVTNATGVAATALGMLGASGTTAV